jgi:hypothetical protein
MLTGLFVGVFLLGLAVLFAILGVRGFPFSGYMIALPMVWLAQAF